MICYFTNWATDRSGDGKYVPENLQNSARYCTHIYYAYAKLDPLTLELKASHIFTDETNGIILFFLFYISRIYSSFGHPIEHRNAIYFIILRFI